MPPVEILRRVLRDYAQGLDRIAGCEDAQTAKFQTQVITPRCETRNEVSQQKGAVSDLQHGMAAGARMSREHLGRLYQHAVQAGMARERATVLGPSSRAACPAPSAFGVVELSGRAA
jgi:hypothetical protein